MDNIIEFINKVFPTDVLDLKSKYRQVFSYVLKNTQNKAMYHTTDALMVGDIVFVDSFISTMLFKTGGLSRMGYIFSELEDGHIKQQLLNEIRLFDDEYGSPVYLHNFIDTCIYKFYKVNECRTKYIDNMDVAILLYTILDYIENNLKTVAMFLSEICVKYTIKNSRTSVYRDLQTSEGWQSFKDVNSNYLVSYAYILLEKLKY